MQALSIIKNESGFTLIEALIAITIFSVGLMAVGFLQANALMKTGNVTRKTEALAIAEAHADWLKSLPFYANVPTQTFNANLVAGVHNQPAPVPNNGRYMVHWQVQDNVVLNAYDNATTPVFDKVDPGIYVVAKYITVVVTPLNGAMATDGLAQLEFLKSWAATRIP